MKVTWCGFSSLTQNKVSSADRAMQKDNTTAVNHRSTCRLCGSKEVLPVLKLEPTPPANAFVDERASGVEQVCYPLDVYFCGDCAHLQLLDIVDPRILFENYVYVSGTSPVFVKHFEDYATYIMERFDPPDGSLIIDIGSNDGTLLKFFKQAGYSVLGIDPALDIARRATEAGIETLPVFFSKPEAQEIKTQRGRASVIAANNVFAHIDDLQGVLDGARLMLSPNGVFVFEVSYLVDVFEKTLFDTIYHEHLDYHSVKPLVGFFDRNGMELIEALRVSSHGGSLRGIAQFKGGPYPVGRSVQEAIALEEHLGLDKAATFKDFARRIDDIKEQLSSLLHGYKSAGKQIAGFGAPAKATTLMYHFGIGPDVVDFIVDDSPLKQGLFTPGMHIPVLSSREIYDKKPDYVVILAWNFAEPIMKNHAAYQESGGHFVVPLPNVEVY